jgi:pyruvate formate lyase activating enzyme
MKKAPFLAVARHRLAIDGEGVTTLAAFHGCSLRCKYCLNNSCLRSDGVWRELTTGELLEMVRIDNLYFLATGGGVTFGGGEPCLRSRFIEEFASMADSRWRITMETCLNVEQHHVERIAPIAHQWLIDIKDTNPDIYKSYTGHDNSPTLSNLQWLLQQEGMAEKIIVRLPLIPEYNTPDDVRNSRKILEEMGVKHFDEFKYLIR